MRQSYKKRHKRDQINLLFFASRSIILADFLYNPNLVPKVPERITMILEVGKIQGLKVYLETVCADGTGIGPRRLRIVKSPGKLITTEDSLEHGFSFIELLAFIEKADRAEIMRVLGSGFARC